MKPSPGSEKFMSSDADSVEEDEPQQLQPCRLERLLFPLTVAEFMSSYWGKRPYVGSLDDETLNAVIIVFDPVSLPHYSHRCRSDRVSVVENSVKCYLTVAKKTTRGS